MTFDTHFPAGIYPATDIPMARYLADPCIEPSLSSGAAHTLIVRSPAHCYAEHPRLGARPQDDSIAADIGTLAHDLLLGGEGKICVIDPAEHRSKPTKDNPEGSIPVGWTNNAIRAARDEARANGLTPILPGDLVGAKMMAAAAKDFIAKSEISGVFRDGSGETTLIWSEEHLGIWCRARPDWLNADDKVMMHYKTTQASANPEAFTRGILFSAGYDVSMAFYRRGLEVLTKRNDFMHVILVQEQAPPYACSLISLDPASWGIADDKVKRALGIWRSCLNSGKWPAYSGRIAYAAPTAWMLAEAERWALEAR